MDKKRFLAFLLAAAAALSAMTACGEADDDDDSEEKKPKASAASSEAEAPETTTTTTTTAATEAAPTETTTTTAAPAETTTTTAAQPAPAANVEAKEFDGHYYAAFENEDAKNMSACEKECVSMGGHLVSITSDKEQKFVESLFGSKDNYWIGLVRDGDSWKWTDGEKFDYTHWDMWVNSKGKECWQPDNYLNKENSVRIAAKDITFSGWLCNKGGWLDTAEDGDNDAPLSSFGFICEWDHKPDGSSDSGSGSEQEAAKGGKVSDYMSVDEKMWLFKLDTSLFGSSFEDFKKKIGRDDLEDPEDWTYWGKDLKVTFFEDAGYVYACFFQYDKFVISYIENDDTTIIPKAYASACTFFGKEPDKITDDGINYWYMDGYTYRQNVEDFMDGTKHQRQMYLWDEMK